MKENENFKLTKVCWVVVGRALEALGSKEGQQGLRAALINTSSVCNRVQRVEPLKNSGTGLVDCDDDGPAATRQEPQQLYALRAGRAV